MTYLHFLSKLWWYSVYKFSVQLLNTVDATEQKKRKWYITDNLCHSFYSWAGYFDQISLLFYCVSKEKEYFKLYLTVIKHIPELACFVEIIKQLISVFVKDVLYRMWG